MTFIIVIKSKPDSLIKNSCSYVNARNIVTTDPKNYYNYNNSKISNKLTITLLYHRIMPVRAE